jgi:hypothetical protein
VADFTFLEDIEAGCKNWENSKKGSQEQIEFRYREKDGSSP